MEQPLQPAPAAGSAGSPVEPPDTAAETREIVTPYAFHVAAALLGQPLATPVRRLFAILIDLLLVAILSSADPFILALVAALTFFKAGSNLAHKSSRTLTRRLLRGSGAVLLFFVTYVIVDAYNGGMQDDDDESGVVTDIPAFIIGSANYLAWGACDNNVACLKENAAEFGEAMADENVEQDDLTTVIDEVLKKQVDDPQTRAEVKQVYFDAYTQAREEVAKASESTQTEPPPALLGTNEAKETPDKPVYSLIELAKGIIGDLGLGFGWAALYFSVFTAWWKGSTPGKRLMRIRVVKLDGSSLTLWESFGRYGGYGAGLATGLLGFLQVFWDPNRQAIQDKISETLVLKRTDALSDITQAVNARNEAMKAEEAKGT